MSDSFTVSYDEPMQDAFLGKIAGQLFSIEAIKSIEKKAHNTKLVCYFNSGHSKHSHTLKKVLQVVKTEYECEISDG